MKSIFNQNDRQELLDRIGKLTPNSQRQWGKFTPDRMVAHLIDSLHVSFGEKPATIKSSFMSNPIARWIIIRMPWPKGKAETVPEMLTRPPGEFKADISTLRELVNAAAQRGPEGKWATHPAFGDISGKTYGALIYKHFNHHLTQFSV